MKSIIPYIGGKSRLAKEVISHFPQHDCYVEVFAGAANIFFRKEPAHTEVLNDINKDLITLYRVIKHHLEEFYRQLKWLLVSRDEFKRFQETPPETLTDIQRAVRYYYLAKLAFGGKVAGQNFGYAPSSPPSFNLMRIEEDLSAAHLRLSQVYIENLPYADILKRYDRDYSLFYLDPPYWGCTDDYGKNLFSEDDFVVLAGILGGIKGRFCLSLNDVEPIRKIYSNFNQKKVTLTYSVSKQGSTSASELLITNY